MERDFTSGGCSLRAIFSIIVVVIVYALFCIKIIAEIAAIIVIGFLAIIVFVLIFGCIFGDKWREDKRKEMGTQYERSPQRKELCKKVFDTETEITTFDDLDFVNIVSDDGYLIEWKYTKDWENLSLEMLIHEGSFSTVKATFQEMEESLMEEFGNEMCKCFTYNVADRKEEHSYSMYIEGLTYVNFVLVLSKDINIDKIEHVLREIKMLARNMKDKFAHRQFDVDYDGRYYLTYRGLVLESVSKKKWKGIKSVDRNKFLSKYGNTKVRTLMNAIIELNLDADYYINGFKDV